MASGAMRLFGKVSRHCSRCCSNNNSSNSRGREALYQMLELKQYWSSAIAVAALEVSDISRQERRKALQQMLRQ